MKKWQGSYLLHIWTLCLLPFLWDVPTWNLHLIDFHLKKKETESHTTTFVLWVVDSCNQTPNDKKETVGARHSFWWFGSLKIDEKMFKTLEVFSPIPKTGRQLTKLPSLVLDTLGLVHNDNQVITSSTGNFQQQQQHAVLMKNGLHKFNCLMFETFQMPTFPLLALCSRQGNSIPFKPASLIIWSPFWKTFGFLGCEKKKKNIVKIQGSVTSHPNYAAKIFVSESVYWKFPQPKGGEVPSLKPSHPTEDPRCHQLDIVVRIHNAEGGRRSPPQIFLCARVLVEWRGFVWL